MRRAINFLLTVLTVGCLCLAVSCSPVDEDNGVSSNIKADAMNDPYGAYSEEMMNALKNSGEVVVYWESNTFSDKDADFLDYFEKYYGGIFVRRYCPSNDDMTVFLQDFYSGTSPDVLRLNDSYWPRTAMRNATYSTERLDELGVIGLDHPALKGDRELTQAAYTYSGRCYAVAMDFVAPAMVAVNKDLFDYCMVGSPSAYFERGNWDVDAFFRCSHEIARTLPNSKKLYACNSFEPSWFLLTNEADPIVFDKYNMLPSLTVPEALRSLARCRTFLTTVSTTDNFDAFRQGELAMLCGTADELAEVLTDCNFSWDVIPFPYDSDNASGRTVGKITAWGISSHTKNAQGAFNFILAYRLFEDFYYNLDDSFAWDNSYVVYNDSQQQRITSMSYMVRPGNFPNISALPQRTDELWNALRGTDPIYDIAALFNDVIEMEYDAEMSDILSQHSRPSQKK